MARELGFPPTVLVSLKSIIILVDSHFKHSGRRLNAMDNGMKIRYVFSIHIYYLGEYILNLIFWSLPR